MRTFDFSAFEAPLSVPQLQSGPVLLRPFLLSDLPLIRQAATDPYIPAVTSVPSTYSDDGGGPLSSGSNVRRSKETDMCL